MEQTNLDMEIRQAKTLEAAVTSAGKISCERFYAVGIGLPSSVNVYTHDDTQYWSHRDNCSEKGQKVQSEYYGTWYDQYYWYYDIFETISGLNILERVKTQLQQVPKVRLIIQILPILQENLQVLLVTS
ncbi:MAG: hypothetical protein ACLRIT_00845 [Blautia sp.]